MNATTIQTRLRKLADPGTAKTLRWFFKTGPGEYGEGDEFIGIKVPVLRQVAREARDLDLRDIRRLLRSRIHEERLLALILLVHRYGKANPAEQQALFDFYLAQTGHINNWDLVDLSAPYLVGPHLADRDPADLLRLARSRNLWERRIAIVATAHFIRLGRFKTTLDVAAILLHDEEDLIHKAVGWMLREVGKRDQATEERFLKRHYQHMPRTMLRYAIERFPEPLRQRYLLGKV